MQILERTKIAVALLILAIVSVAFIIGYEPAFAAAKPATVAKDTIVCTSVTTSAISLKWGKAKRATHYYVFYKKKGTKYKKWSYKKAISTNYKITKLSKGTEYAVKIRARNGSVKGNYSSKVYFRTAKEVQSISSANWFFRTTGDAPFKLNASAMTKLSYKSGNTQVASVSSKGVVTPVGTGETVVTVKAAETDYYEAASKKVYITVRSGRLESCDKVTVLGVLDDTCCEPVIAVKGVGGATVPQSFCYTGSEYIVSYQANSYSYQYLKSYTEEGEEGTYLKQTGRLDLGHANGLAFCDVTERIYSVSGKTSQDAQAGKTLKRFDTSLGEIAAITNMANSVSGIAYDSTNKYFYFSQAGNATTETPGKILKMKLQEAWKTDDADALNAEAEAFKKSKTKCVSKIRNEGTGSKAIADQDIGGHNGIVFVGIGLGSTSSEKKNNSYVDMYRVSDGNYLGSFRIAMGEIESIEVDDNGYLILLVNQSGTTDYIWRTNIQVTFS